MGITLDLGEAQPDDDLWVDHLPAWRAWCAVSTQLVTQSLTFGGAGLGGAAISSKLLWFGLDYARAKAGLDLAGIITTPDLWEEVRWIEEGAVEELNRG